MKLVLYGAETYCINNRVRKLIQDIDDMNVSRYQGLSREAVAATSRYPIGCRPQHPIRRFHYA